jgi:hypothetical protein
VPIIPRQRKLVTSIGQRIQVVQGKNTVGFPLVKQEIICTVKIDIQVTLPFNLAYLRLGDFFSRHLLDLHNKMMVQKLTIIANKPSNNPGMAAVGEQLRLQSEKRQLNVMHRTSLK